MAHPFNHWFHWQRLAKMPFELPLVMISVMTGYVWFGNDLLLNREHLFLFAMIFGVAILTISFGPALYQGTKNTNNVSVARVVLFLCLTTPAVYGILTLLPSPEFTLEFVQISSMSVGFGILISRVSSTHPASPGLLAKRILVYGTGPRAIEVKRALEKSHLSSTIVGFFPAPNEKTTLVPINQVLPHSASLCATAQSLKAEEIVVALSERRGGAMPLRELLDCRLQGIRVLDLASYFEQTLGQIRLDSLYAGWLIFGDGFQQGYFRIAMKRLSDIVFASILLILAIPVMLLTALLILIESGGPVLYRQERVGLNGRLFKVIKFRSMRSDAEKDGKAIWAKANDDRVTRVGRVIRKLRIDELPQLFSVLKGEMSLIGPRPERPFFVDQLTREIPFYAVRHSVKPGLTGWAQVRYHYGATIEDSAEKLQYDLYYVKNNSLFLDVVILFETIGVVLTGKGAH